MKVHLIGIGGTGMGALAGLLVEAGHEVRGSDGPLYPPMSTLLEQLRVPVLEGFRPENLDWGPDRVVVGNICRVDHPEAAAARERGMHAVSFPALLSELFLSERHPIVVAGTHGKTTTSSMLAHLLTDAGARPGYLIGGVPLDLGRSYALGQPPYFVVEGDEYDCAYFDKRPKFVHYQPRTVILTGVEYDHADIYPDMAAVERAFAMLLERVPADGQVFVCADSEAAIRLCRSCPGRVESYSASCAEARWQGQPRPLYQKQQQVLNVTRDGEPVLEARLSLSGTHNAQNALAVAATALSLGIEAERVAEALGRFSGVRRRQEVRGEAGGVTVIDDFAHHPTAIYETLAGLREVTGAGRLVAVFEPRSATSRRKVFEQRFAEALAVADYAVIAGLHDPAGIAEPERLDPRQVVRLLRASGVGAAHLETVEAIVEHLLRICEPEDTVVVMSSGSFGGLPDRLLAALASEDKDA